jgi:hypothetical protein
MECAVCIYDYLSTEKTVVLRSKMTFKVLEIFQLFKLSENHIAILINAKHEIGKRSGGMNRYMHSSSRDLIIINAESGKAFMKK